MTDMIFINLAVDDLPKSMSYYRALGFSHNPQFTDETAACIVISETIFVMLLTHEKFKFFSPNPITDTKAQTSALYALSRNSRDDVDKIAAAGLSAGGSEYRDIQDLGFMYSRAIADPDGHVWEYMYMDMSQMGPT